MRNLYEKSVVRAFVGDSRRQQAEREHSETREKGGVEGEARQRARLP